MQTLYLLFVAVHIGLVAVRVATLAVTRREHGSFEYAIRKVPFISFSGFWY
jgi:hypothetical protein